jgi:hypothetical protein
LPVDKPSYLPEVEQEHGEDPDGQDDLKPKAHVIVVAVVELNTDSVEAGGDL